jgi:hypothetical protein
MYSEQPRIRIHALAQESWRGMSRRLLAMLTHCMEIGNLMMSAGLNALPFTGAIFDATHWAQIALRMFRAGGD